MRACLNIVAGLLLSTSQFDQVNSFQSSFTPAQTLFRNTPLHPTLLDVKTNRARTSTQLEVSPLTAIASSPIGAISVLAGIVLIHEAGHYLAARGFNISVEEFSIGFGPKLVGFEAIGNEFNLRALPLGGYVRFPVNYDIKAVDELQQKAQDAFMKRREDEDWTSWQDAINIATFGLWDEQRRQKRKADQATQAAEVAAGRSWWQKAIRGDKTNTKLDPEDFEMPYYDDPNLLQNRPWAERAVVLSGGVIFNMILAFLLYFGQINLGSGIPQPVFDSGVVITQAPRSDGASVGLLRQGDVIVGINGRAIEMSGQGPMSAQRQVSAVIGGIRETSSGESVILKVQRENKALDVSIKPQGSGSTQSIGVFLGPNFKEIRKLQSNDVMEAAKLAYQYLSEVISQTLNGVLSLIGMLLMGTGPPPGQSVSGPIGLIKSGTEIVSTRDVTAVLLFAAALSVNLGVINALPLPALDGGQLVFVLAEAITGKKVDQRLQEGITGVAVFLLLGLSVSTAVSDVGSILNGLL